MAGNFGIHHLVCLGDTYFLIWIILRISGAIVPRNLRLSCARWGADHTGSTIGTVSEFGYPSEAAFLFGNRAIDFDLKCLIGLFYRLLG